MPGKRHGIIAPQNTFLENVIRKTSALRVNFIVANARIEGYPIVFASDGFCAMIGCRSKADVLSKSALCDFLYAPSTDSLAKFRLREACGRRSHTQIEVLLSRLDGSPFCAHVQVAQIKDANDDVVLLLLTFKQTPTKLLETDSRLRRLARFARGFVRKEGVSVSDVGAFSVRKKASEACHKAFDNLRQYRQEAPNVPPFIIPHYGTFKSWWDWMLLLLTTYTAIMVPVNVAFQSKTMDSTMLLIADAFIDLVFFVDLILNFRTTFVGKSREIIIESKAIRLNYLRSWFLIDLLSCLPYDAFFSIGDQQRAHISILSGLKVFRLLRIGRVVRKLDQYLETGGAVLLLLVLCFLLVSHWLACIWYSLGCSDQSDGLKYGWITELHHKSSSNYHHRGHEHDQVSNANDTTEPSKVEAYITALYFVVTCTTAVGFGNVAANTELEKIFSLFSMAIGAMMCATIFGNITTIFQQMFFTNARYHTVLNEIKSFARLHALPPNLAGNMLDYVVSRWSLTEGVDQDSVLLYCPPNMKGDICVHLNRDIFNSNPAFRLASEVCLRALALHVVVEHHAPGDVIIRKGDKIDAIFFVVSGTLEVTQDDQIVALLVKGDVFGNAFWQHRAFKQCVCSVKTSTYANVHSIKCSKFLDVLDAYPVFAKSFYVNMTINYDLHRQWTLLRSEVSAESTNATAQAASASKKTFVARLRRFSQGTFCSFPLVQRRMLRQNARAASCENVRPQALSLPLPKVKEEDDIALASCSRRFSADLPSTSLHPTSTTPANTSQRQSPVLPIQGLCAKCGSDVNCVSDLQQLVRCLAAQLDDLAMYVRRDLAALDSRVRRHERLVDLLVQAAEPQARRPPLLSTALRQVALAQSETSQSSLESLALDTLSS